MSSLCLTALKSRTYQFQALILLHNSPGENWSEWAQDFKTFTLNEREGFGCVKEQWGLVVGWWLPLEHCFLVRWHLHHWTPAVHVPSTTRLVHTQMSSLPSTSTSHCAAHFSLQSFLVSVFIAASTIHKLHYTICNKYTNNATHFSLPFPPSMETIYLYVHCKFYSRLVFALLQMASFKKNCYEIYLWSERNKIMLMCFGSH